VISTASPSMTDDYIFGRRSRRFHTESLTTDAERAIGRKVWTLMRLPTMPLFGTAGFGVHRTNRTLGASVLLREYEGSCILHDGENLRLMSLQRIAMTVFLFAMLSSCCFLAEPSGDFSRWQGNCRSRVSGEFGCVTQLR
jgi:hypothetical protein